MKIWENVEDCVPKNFGVGKNYNPMKHFHLHNQIKKTMAKCKTIHLKLFLVSIEIIYLIGGIFCTASW